jgi:hypothetical protein
MNPNRFGLGLSYYLNNIELSYALLTHSILSNSNVLTIKIDFE